MTNPLDVVPAQAGTQAGPGPAPVLYLPVVRAAELSAVQAQVWAAVDPHSAEAEAYYRPERWMPHITLGLGDVQPETLGRIVAGLSARRFEWTIPIRDLSLIVNAGAGQAVRGRHPLSGRGP